MTRALTIKRDNNITITHPHLLEEWDWDNNDKDPTEVSRGSGYLANWICKECGNSYQSKVASRSRGRGCPKCGMQRFFESRTKPKEGNSLADKYPELIQEWHPTKNGDKTPWDYRPHSNKTVWWQCRFGHEWTSSIHNRTASKPRGCPECKRYMKTSFPEHAIFYYVSKFFDDAVGCTDVSLGGRRVSFDVWIPSIRTAIEYDGGYWHSKANRDASKDAICFENGVRLIRVREPECAIYNDVLSTIHIDRDDARSSKSLDDAIRSVLHELGCGDAISVDTVRDCNEIRAGMIAAKVKNSFGDMFPEIAKEWHPTKNGDLTPYMVSQHSGVLAWFVCPNGHEYRTAVCDRSYGKRCYKCAQKENGRKKMIPGEGESLAELHPDIAAIWHQEMNNDFTPYDVKPNSNKRFWWKCAKCGHVFESSVQKRVKSGRPLCRKCSMEMTCEARRMSTGEFRARVAKSNPTIDVIGEYTGHGNKIECRCTVCEHVWNAWPQNILRGHGCDVCARERRRETRKKNKMARQQSSPN